MTPAEQSPKSAFAKVGLVFAGIVVLTLLAILGWNWYTEHQGKVAVQQVATKLRADSTQAAFDLLLEKGRRQLLENQQSEAAKKALSDEQNRKERDNQTMLLIAAMNRPQQDIQALRGLIEGGFLPRERYVDTLTVIRKDSAYTAGVATQGQVLTNTRSQLNETNGALRLSVEKASDLELYLNTGSASIGDTRMYVQDRIAERGLLRGKSRREFREVDRRLSDIQKNLKHP